MPRIVIAGCGFLGEAAAALFFEDGWDVLALTSSQSSARALRAKSYTVDALDISDAGAVSRLREHPFDVVLHCASSQKGGAVDYERVYRDGVRNLADALPSARVVFTSSTSVYAQCDGSIVDEDSEASPDRQTGKILLEAEEVVLQANGVVLRLSGLYGPGRSVLMSRFLDGSARLESGGSRWINQIHRDDAALACRRAVDLPSGVYNVSDDTPAAQRDVYGWLAEFFNAPLPPEGVANPNRKRGLTNKRVSNARLRSKGWAPRFPSYKDAIPVIAPTIQSSLTS